MQSHFAGGLNSRRLHMSTWCEVLIKEAAGGREKDEGERMPTEGQRRFCKKKYQQRPSCWSLVILTSLMCEWFQSEITCQTGFSVISIRLMRHVLLHSLPRIGAQNDLMQSCSARLLRTTRVSVHNQNPLARAKRRLVFAYLRRLPFVNLTQKCHLTIFVLLNINVFQWGTF